MSLLSRAILAHRGWRYRLRVDPAEIRWMRGMLRTGDVAADIGAYKGGYTYWMRREVGDDGAVVAFEPQAVLADYLRRRAADFGWTNVLVHEMALSAEHGTMELLRPTDEPSPAASLVGASLPDGARSTPVPVDTLDAVLDAHPPGGPVRLIKCDVEGHELEVFMGARRTLEEYRPLLLLECEQRHLTGRTMQDVFGHLERLGYEGSFFLEGRRRDVAEFRIEHHQVEGRRPYVNNFVFTPKEVGAG